MRLSDEKRSNALTYSIEEMSRLLGIGKNHAYQAAARGDFPTIRIGKRLMVPKAAAHRMLGLGADGESKTEAA